GFSESSQPLWFTVTWSGSDPSAITPKASSKYSPPQPQRHLNYTRSGLFIVLIRAAPIGDLAGARGGDVVAREPEVRRVEKIRDSGDVFHRQPFRGAELLDHAQVFQGVARAFQDIDARIPEPAGLGNPKGRRIKPPLDAAVAGRNIAVGYPVGQA